MFPGCIAMYWVNFGGLKCIALKSEHPFPNTFSFCTISPLLTFPVSQSKGRNSYPMEIHRHFPRTPQPPSWLPHVTQVTTRKHCIFTSGTRPPLDSCPFLLHPWIRTKVHNQTPCGEPPWNATTVCHLVRYYIILRPQHLRETGFQSNACITGKCQLRDF